MSGAAGDVRFQDGRRLLHRRRGRGAFSFTRPVIVLSMGIGAVAALLWLFGGSGIKASTAPAWSASSTPGVSVSQEPPESHLFDMTSIHYVTTAGTDGGDCSTPGGACRTIQYAVDQADEGDEIRVAAGVYTDVSVRPRRDISVTGVVTQIVYLNKTVSVRGGYTLTNWTVSNPVANPTTLDARGQGRVFYISAPALGVAVSPTIKGLRLTGGDALGMAGSSQGDAGGGIYVISASVTVRDSQVLTNAADVGGGLYLDSGTLLFSGNTVSSNTSDEYGCGGLYLNESFATFSDNTISSNHGHGVGGLCMFSGEAMFADNIFSANTSAIFCGGLLLGSSNVTLRRNTISSNYTYETGGGVCLSGSDATLIDNRVTNNTAMYAGGLYIGNGNVTLAGNTISSNTAHFYGSGGGLMATFNSVITLTDNIISFNDAEWSSGGGLMLSCAVAKLNGNGIFSNTARAGGGIYIGATDAVLANNVIADNHASTGSGLYLYISGTTPSLVHNTIAHNIASGDSDGSGIYIGGLTGTVTLTNNILVSHTLGISVAAGNTAKLDGTLWGNGTWANDADWGGDGIIITGTVNLWDDPAFVDPDAGNYHVRFGSAAVDAGVDAGVVDDMDGDLRPFDGDRDGVDALDIGADEMVPHLAVTKQATPDPVQPGARLTYTLRVTNTGHVDLRATITDRLPLSVTLGETSGGTLVLPEGKVGITWTALITAPGGIWTRPVVVTVDEGYGGPLTNQVEVTAEEGARGKAAAIVNAYKTYLPLVLRNHSSRIESESVFTPAGTF